MRLMIIPTQLNKEGLAKIYLETVTTTNGKRQFKRVPTKYLIPPNHWDKKKGEVKKTYPNYEVINHELLKFKLDTTRPEPVKVVVKDSLVTHIDRYIELRKAKGTKHNSVKQFTTLKNRLVKYQEEKNTVIRFADMTLKFSDDFIIWHNNNKYDPNTIEKAFTILETVLNHYYERREEFNITEFPDVFRKKTGEARKPFGNVITHESPPLPLTFTEFQTLKNRQNLSPELQRVAITV